MTRREQLAQWIGEAEESLRDGLPICDESGERMSIASTEACIAMWREEMGKDEIPPMPGEIESDFPTIYEIHSEEQMTCAANGHQPWVIATRTEKIDVFGTQTRRVRYCTGCGMEHPSRRPAKVA